MLLPSAARFVFDYLYRLRKKNKYKRDFGCGPRKRELFDFGGDVDKDRYLESLT